MPAAPRSFVMLAAEALLIGFSEGSWVDRYGRVLAQVDFFTSTDRTRVAQVPTAHVDTVYTAFGRWLGWLCVAGFLPPAAWAVLGRRTAR
jgi:apolipoprotein N-acyltransferase